MSSQENPVMIHQGSQIIEQRHVSSGLNTTLTEAQQRQVVASTTTQSNSHRVIGEARVLGERVIERDGPPVVVSERIVEHEVMMPKKVVREDVYEKTVVMPERVVHEELIEEVQTIREKIIEVAVPIIQEKVVEIPEIEFVEKIIEVPEVIVQERVVQVPRIEYVDKIVEVPTVRTQEKVIEVPEIVYHDVPVERIVEVPEIKEKIVYKKVPVPQYVEVNVPEYKDVVQEREIIRSVPVPVEAVTTCKFKLPKLRPRYTKVEVPIRVPRFVEVPVASDSIPHNSVAMAQAQRLVQQLTAVTQQQHVSLCEIESLAHEMSKLSADASLNTPTTPELLSGCVTDAWQSGRLSVDPTTLTYTHCETVAPLIQ